MMSKLILYLLEASAALIVLYALYFLLLRKLTFFSLNRFFLLTILVFSFFFPFLSFDFWASSKNIIKTPAYELRDMRMSYYNAFEDWTFQGTRNGSAENSTVNYEVGESINFRELILTFVLTFYAIGFVAMNLRLVWTYAWIYRLKSAHEKEMIDGMEVVKVAYPMAPFSYMKSVFIHEDSLQKYEFDQILAHEKIHISQLHSIDLLFVQLLATIQWFNPVVWQLIKSLKTTHEYIADKKMINQGYALVEYQTLLLRQLISNNSFGLVHNFNLSFIKKRITMMKIKESGWAGKAKVAIALSTVVLFSLVIVQCNSRLEDPEASLAEFSRVSSASDRIDLPVLSETGIYKSNVDISNSLTLLISNNVLRVNGKELDVKELASVIKAANLTESSIIIIETDKSQQMGLVRDVHDVLRTENKRKVLYQFSNEKKETMELPMLLPPDPNSSQGNLITKITDEYAKENGIDLMKVSVKENIGVMFKTKVADFVQRNVDNGSSNFVVSIKFEDDDLYYDYISSLFYVSGGFDQIYEERSQKMFGKSFYDLDKNDKEGKEMYNAVRKGIPKAISIAEED